MVIDFSMHAFVFYSGIGGDLHHMPFLQVTLTKDERVVNF